MNKREIADANLILLDLEREICPECQGECRVDGDACGECEGDGTVFIREGEPT